MRTKSAEAVLRVLEWDTEFFGARMGELSSLSTSIPAPERAQELRALLVTSVEIAQREHFEHVLVRCNAGDWALVRAAEGAGMRLVDAAVDLSQPAAERRSSPTAKVPTRVAEPGDLVWAAPFGAQAFVHSRFAADPFFSDEQVRNFHHRWVTNLWNGLAQHVIVAQRDDAPPLGFVACGLAGDDGRIILIASEADARKTGVGRSLVWAALDWFAQAGAKTVRVKTQFSNIPAMALYERCGFTVERSELTYVWTPPDKGARA